MKKESKRNKPIDLTNSKETKETTARIDCTAVNNDWEDQKQRILEACIESQLSATHKAYFIDQMARIVLGRRYEPFIGRYNEHHKRSPWKHGVHPKEAEEEMLAEIEFFDEVLDFPETVEDDSEKESGDHAQDEEHGDRS